MSIGAEHGQYILQTQFKKNSEDSIRGVWTPPPWVRRWAYLKLRQEWTAGWS